MFLKLVSAKGCQGFRETKMRNGGSFLRCQKFVCRIKIRVSIFDTNNSVTPDSCTWEFIVSKDSMVCTILISLFNLDLNFHFPEMSLMCTEE